MVKTLRLTYFSFGFAILVLFAGFLMAGHTFAALSTIPVGALSAYATHKNWRTGQTLSLIFLMLAISFAGLADTERFLLLLSALSALAAWDLGNFHFRLSQNDTITAEDILIRTHLLRLSAVLILGLSLPLIAFSLEFRLQFWQVFILGFLLLFGLGQIFTQLKRNTE